MPPTACFEHAARSAKDQAGYLQTKDVPLAMQEDADTFTAYYSVFGAVDRQNEVVEKGAYVNLDREPGGFLEDGWIGYNHRQDEEPIGAPLEAVQDSFGLRVVARWHSTPKAQAVRQIVKERLADGLKCLCSVGFKTLEAVPSTVKGKQVKSLRRIWLAECSIVNLPANQLASVISSKSVGGGRKLGRCLTLEETRRRKAEKLMALRAQDRQFKANFAEMARRIETPVMAALYEPDPVDRYFAVHAAMKADLDMFRHKMIGSR
jgi:HK97 family phage prohead protease